MPYPHRILRLLSFLFLIVIQICSCSSTENAVEEYSFDLIEEDGIPVAVTRGGPKYNEELFIYEPVVTLHEDQRHESLLYNPTQFVMDERGWFYVYDSDGDYLIAVFDSTGRFSHSFGRKGAGPGEFRSPRFQSVCNGCIILWDPSQRRVTRYTTEGVLIDVIPVTRSFGYSITRYFITDDDRRVLLERETEFSRDGPIYQVGFTVENAGGDTLATLKSEKINTGYMGKMNLGGRMQEMPMMYVFGPNPSANYMEGTGILIWCSWSALLDIYDFDGNLSRKIRIEMEPEPPSREEREEVRAYYRRLIEEEEAARDYFESELKYMRFPDYKAPWSFIETDERGYIWLRYNDIPDYELMREEGYMYHIISPEGEYLGITQRPPGLGTYLRDGFLLNNYSDLETGNFQFTKFRIRSAIAGFNYP